MKESETDMTSIPLLIQQAQVELERSAAEAEHKFSMALAQLKATPVAGSDVWGITLGLCLGLAQVRQNHFTDAIESASQTLARLPSLSWPESRKLHPQKLDIHVARATLEKVLATLTAQGLVAFPCAGTLLGLTREGHLLPFDKDVDIACPINFFDRIAQVLLQLGWKPVWLGVDAVNFRAFFHPEHIVTLDLFGYDFDSQHHRMIGGWWPRGLPREQGRLLHFSEVQLHQVSSPHGPYWHILHPETILSELYGPHWREPDPDFDSILGTPALVAHNDFTHAWGYLRLLEAWTHGQRDRFARQLRILERLDPHDAVVAMLKSAVVI